MIRNNIILLSFDNIFRRNRKNMSSLGYSSIRPIQKQNGFSLHQISKWNKQLQMQRLKTIHAQEQIKKQKKQSQQNNIFLKKQIEDIDQEAIQLSKILQQEKAKHEHLVVLVKNVETQLEKQKLERYEDVLNKKQPDEFEEQKKILSQKDRKLQKLLQKLNSSEFQISKKIDAIRFLRRERGIHSNVFDKLEREHFDVQFYYKQLLIERTLIEKQLDKNIAHFNLVYQKSGNQAIKMKQTEQKIQQEKIQNTEKLLHFKTQHSVKKQPLVTLKVHELLNLCKENDFHSTQRYKSKKQITLSKISEQRNLEEMKKLEFKKKIQSVLNDFGCQNVHEFYKKGILNQSQDHQTFYGKSINAYDEISNIENEIKHLEQQLQQKRNIPQHTMSKKRLNLKTQISQFQSQIEQTKHQVTSFKEQFEKICSQFIDLNQQNNKSYYFKRNLNWNQRNSDDLTFHENQDLLKELMIFFNEEMLENYMQGVKNGQLGKSRAYPQKVMLRKKNKKLSSLGFEKKVKIVRTQTQNSHHSSYSVVNSSTEYLNAILNMQSSECQKVQKGQKVDKLSILTEDELVQQSKRLIRQIHKKKSQFTNNTPSINRK